MVKSEVANFMSDNDTFIRRILMFRNVHKPCGTIKGTECARTEIQIPYFKVILRQRRLNQGLSAAITIRNGKSFFMTSARLATDFNPGIHAQSSSSQ